MGVGRLMGAGVLGLFAAAALAGPLGLSGEGTSPPSSIAATRFGWGAPSVRDEFDEGTVPDPNVWRVYDGPGHGGQGRRSPEAFEVRDGHVRVSGDADGVAGGMAMRTGRLHGRWEARMRTGDRVLGYHPVLLLWPDDEPQARAWEIDYAEGTERTAGIDFYLHFQPDSVPGHQAHAFTVLDTTRWHQYAVEWTPERVTGYVDGEVVFTDDDPDHVPDLALHQTIQLDRFPADGPARAAWMDVDWVRVYDL